ncbi:unnamed protein product [Arabidopsis halleri]
MNLQNLNFFNPGGQQVNEVLQISRVRFLTAAEMVILMNNFEDFPNGGEEPVPELNTGLYRRDCTEYNDLNQWDIVTEPGTHVTSHTMRRNGEVVFNYTQASLIANGIRFIRRTIRRRQTWNLFTLVHYLNEPIDEMEM